MTTTENIVNKVETLADGKFILSARLLPVQSIVKFVIKLYRIRVQSYQLQRAMARAAR